MGYFSQLARETNSRVLPPRGPSWIQPAAQMVVESAAEFEAGLRAVPLASSPTRAVDTRSGFDATKPRMDAQDIADAREHSDPSARSTAASGDEWPRIPSDFRSDLRRATAPREFEQDQRNIAIAQSSPSTQASGDTDHPTIHPVILPPQSAAADSKDSPREMRTTLPECQFDMTPE